MGGILTDDEGDRHLINWLVFLYKKISFLGHSKFLILWSKCSSSLVQSAWYLLTVFSPCRRYPFFYQKRKNTKKLATESLSYPTNVELSDRTSSYGTSLCRMNLQQTSCLLLLKVIHGLGKLNGGRCRSRIELCWDVGFIRPCFILLI